jgi:divalent metal cation (Fe/Co/Zn/Cd) transporter
VFVPVAEDISALAGVVVAFIGIYLARALNIPALDAAASIVIGFILAGVAIFLGYETRALLVGEGISESLNGEVERICQEDEGVERVVRIMGVYLGPDDILLTLGLEFSAGHDVEDAARAVDRIERRLREADPRVTRVFVEPEVSTDRGGLATPF